MERKDKIAICEKVIKGSKFKVRINYFGNWVIESSEWVVMWYYDDMYDFIFNNNRSDFISWLNIRLEEHYKCITESEKRASLIREREKELINLYLED